MLEIIFSSMSKFMELADNSVLADLTTNVDRIVHLGHVDTILGLAVVKFQLDHQTLKCDYHSDQDESASKHLYAVLDRMMDLSFTVSWYVMKRVTKLIRSPSPNSSDSFGDSPRPNKIDRNSSVDDLLNEESDFMLEAGANLFHAAICCSSLCIIAHPVLRSEVQEALVDKGFISLVEEALAVSVDNELRYFAEGFRTNLIMLLANLTYENIRASESILKMDKLTTHIYQSTRVDENNPGLAEWAEFAVRNICRSCPEGCEIFKKLRCVR